MAGTLQAGSQITITVPPLDTIVTAGLQLAGQFGLQQAYFKNVIKPAPKPVTIAENVQVTNITNQPQPKEI